MSNTDEKFVKTRDSATRFLKGLGVNKIDYDKFIEKGNWGGVTEFRILVGEAKEFLGNGHATPEKSIDEKTVDAPVDMAVADAVVKAVKKEVKKDIAAAAKEIIKKVSEKKSAERFTGKRTVSAVCRAMIVDGKTNAEIWAVIKEEFKLGDNKKHYPAWYRSEAKRKEA
jgi:hypothetical protein